MTMQYIGLLLLAAPVVGVPETVLIPGDKDMTCQFEIQGGYMALSEIRATDAKTGQILFAADIGTQIVNTECINAPDRHDLSVIFPATKAPQ